METLKTPSEYFVDFNCEFQGFSMANLEKGIAEVCHLYLEILIYVSGHLICIMNHLKLILSHDVASGSDITPYI